MGTTRRKFLTRLAGAVLGSAAVLLRPNQLLAGWRRRGGGPCLPPPLCPPVLYFPSPPMPQEPRRGLATDVTPAYPNASVTTIPGGGDFCCWGGQGPGVIVTGVQATDSSGTALSTQPMSVSVITSLLTIDWGLAIGGFANQSGFYLVYLYTKNGVNMKTGTYGPYST